MNIHFLQFIKFGIVGVSNTAVYYIFYSGLVYIKVSYLLANIVAAIVSILNSYFWNNRYVFKMEKNEKRNIWGTLIKTFLAYAGTWLVLSNIILVFFVEIIRVSEYIAPIFVLFITVPLNFVINKVWAFKPQKDN